MSSIEEIRARIDKIDADIVALLEERAQVVLVMKQAKERDEKMVYSPDREQVIFDRVRALSAGGTFPPHLLDKIFRNIVSATRSLIGELVVAVPGGEHSAPHEACLKQFGDGVRPLFCANAQDCLLRMGKGEAHYALLSVEGSVPGQMEQILKGLLDGAVEAVAEVELENGAHEGMRFLVFGAAGAPQAKERSDRVKEFRTSFICVVSDRTGVLREVLLPFEQAGILLTKIESKPLPSRAGAYIFFIECVGTQDSPVVSKALAELRLGVSELRVLGTYPLGSRSVSGKSDGVVA